MQLSNKIREFLRIGLRVLNTLFCVMLFLAAITTISALIEYLATAELLLPVMLGCLGLSLFALSSQNTGNFFFTALLPYSLYYFALQGTIALCNAINNGIDELMKPEPSSSLTPYYVKEPGMKTYYYQPADKQAKAARPNPFDQSDDYPGQQAILAINKYR